MDGQGSRQGFANVKLVVGHHGPSSVHKLATLKTTADVPLWVAVSPEAMRTRARAQKRWRRQLSLRPRSDTLLGH